MYITSRVDHWKSCIGSIWRQTVILGRMRNDGFLSLIVPVPTSRVLAGQRGRCGNCGCLWCKPQFGHDLWPTFYTDKHFIKCICCDVGGEKVVVAINPTVLAGLIYDPNMVITWPNFYTDKHFIKFICCDVGGEKLVVAINPTEGIDM